MNHHTLLKLLIEKYEKKMVSKERFISEASRLIRNMETVMLIQHSSPFEVIAVVSNRDGHLN